MSKAKRALDDLKRVRKYEEEDLASNLENVFSKTADKYIRDEIQPIEGKVTAELDETKKKTSDANEQAMYVAFGNRWETEKKGRGNKTYKLTSKDNVNKDFIMLRDNGPEALMKELLQSRMIPGATPAAAPVRQYTDAQIDTMLADKSEGSFYKKMESEVAIQLLQRKILAGGIRRADVFAIQNAPWGEGVVRKALDKYKANAAELERLIGEKAINPGFMSKLWQETKKRPWLLLLLVGMVALPVLAAKEGIPDMAK